MQICIVLCRCGMKNATKDDRSKNIEMVLRTLIVILATRGLILSHTRDTLLGFLKVRDREPKKAVK